MKKKIVIKMVVNCDKCRKKAMKVAAVADGVMSVALTGENKDKLVVIGDGVDAACLTTALRKKACYATLETVEEIKPPPLPPPPDTDKDKDTGDKDKDKNTEDKDEAKTPPCYPPICYQQPPCQMHKVVYDSYDKNPDCTIL